MREETDDEALMAQVAEGDHAAYGLLVERHLARALGLARRVLRNPADAEEAVQDALLRVWTHAERWRGAQGTFRVWFNRILVNLCIDRRRRRTHAPLEAAGDPADERPDGFDRAAERQEAARVRAQLAALPERQQAALQLCYFEGLSNQEAAQVLGVSVKALESLLIRGRRALKAGLAAELGIEGVGDDT